MDTLPLRGAVCLIFLTRKINYMQSEYDSFFSYAETRLKEHLAEISTNYDGRAFPNIDLKKKTVEKHLELYKSELRDKANTFKTSPDDKKLSGIWNELINNYELKFMAAAFS